MSQTPESTTPSCCSSTQPEVDAAACPQCRERGKGVKPVTLEHLLVPAALDRIIDGVRYRLCRTPDCEVAWYPEGGGDVFTVNDTPVVIGQKQSGADRSVCYCFDYTAGDIEAQVVASGTSEIPDIITEHCRRGEDRCPETNPQGSCCLGNVRAVLKAAQHTGVQ